MRDKLIEAVARELHHAGWEKDYWTASAKQVLAAIELSGYRVVPVEPTEAMITAAFNVAVVPAGDAIACYDAMLEAAPKVTP